MNAVTQANPTSSPATEEVCNLLLEIAGRPPGRMLTARRYARILDAAAPQVASPQGEEADGEFIPETMWGRMLPEHSKMAANDGIERETRVAGWLSKSKTWVR